MFGNTLGADLQDFLVSCKWLSFFHLSDLGEEYITIFGASKLICQIVICMGCIAKQMNRKHLNHPKIKLLVTAGTINGNIASIIICCKLTSSAFLQLRRMISLHRIYVDAIYFVRCNINPFSELTSHEGEGV